MNWLLEFVGDVPEGVVTVILTVAGEVSVAVELAGDTASISVPPSTTLNDMAGILPKSTAVVPSKKLPDMTTSSPPEIAPASGETEFMSGGGPVKYIVGDVPTDVSMLRLICPDNPLGR